MQILFYLLGSIALCSAALSRRQEERLCPMELYAEAHCCATNEARIEDLSCGPLDITPESVNAFEDNCAGKGLRARCCATQVVGEPIMCQSPGAEEAQLQ